MSRISISCIALRKFGHELKLCLVLLLIINIGLEMGLFNIILHLGLTICFWIESSRESPFDPQEIIMGGPKF